MPMFFAIPRRLAVFVLLASAAALAGAQPSESQLQPDSAPAQTREAKALLDAWQGKGLSVVVTHQVNITAITGVIPASGEAVVLRRDAGQWAVVG